MSDLHGLFKRALGRPPSDMLGRLSVRELVRWRLNKRLERWGHSPLSWWDAATYLNVVAVVAYVAGRNWRDGAHMAELARDAQKRVQEARTAQRRTF